MALELMPAGLSPRRYGHGLEPVGDQVEQCGRDEPLGGFQPVRHRH
jgi:hypothetical protein